MADQPDPNRPAPRRRKHLHDPNNPRPARRDPMNLERVQRWVLSTLAVSTGLHMAAGVVAAAAYVDADRPGARIGLLIIAGIFGVGSVVAGLALHHQRILSWWLLLGWLPTLIGAYLLFWR